MSSPARALRSPQGHYHLPSVHIRGDGWGFDYEEDVLIRGRGRNRLAARVVRLVAFKDGEVVLARETKEQLCAEELAEFDAGVDFFMDGENPAVIELMEERGRLEFDRQRRIAAGREQACRACGCSETRACSGGCLWATASLCSRCA